MSERFRIWLHRPSNLKIESVRQVLKVLLAILFSRVFILINKLNPEVYRLAIAKVSKDRLLYTETENELWLADAHDTQIGLNLFVSKRAFDFEKLSLAKEVVSANGLPAPDTIIDIGAHIGTISIPAIKRHYFKYGIAFEPDPRNFQLLELNIVLNELENQFETHNIALTNYGVESVEFEISDSRQGDHRVHTTNEAGNYDEKSRKVIKVPAKPLDDFSSNLRGIPLLWMDTQGYEAVILEGASRILESTPVLVIEFWPYAMKRMETFPRLIKVLSNSKYSHFVDLGGKYPDLVELSVRELEKKYIEVSEDGRYTDLLILRIDK